MTDKKKQADSQLPKLGDIAAELASARDKAGISHSELHRLTGISRTVLIGYEAGRTKPGAREIRLLCDALKVTPNRLIYGSDDSPFVANSLRERLGLDSNDVGTVRTTMFFSMLNREERDALITLAHSILVARHGKQKVDESLNAIEAFEQTLTSDDVFEAFRNNRTVNEIGESIAKKIEEKIKKKPPKKKS